MALKCYPANSLESAATVTVLGSASGKPKERLFDRDIGLPWQSSASGTQNIDADQGVGKTAAVGAVALEPSHNLAGVSCEFYDSADASAYTLRDTFTPTAGWYRRVLPSVFTNRSHRLRMITPAAAPSIGELLFSREYVLSAPTLDGLRLGSQGNVARAESTGGYVWKRKRGVPRWRATVPYRELPAADRTTLETIFAAASETAKPFLIEDPEGTLRWVEWLDAELLFDAAPITRWHTTLELLEAI